MRTVRSRERIGAVPGDGERDAGLGVGRILVTGAAITGTGAILGLIVGALADGDAGFWAFVGMGAGAVVAVTAMAVRAMRAY